MQTTLNRRKPGRPRSEPTKPVMLRLTVTRLNVTAPNGEVFAVDLADTNDIEALRAAGLDVMEIMEVIEVDAWVMGILTGMKMQ